MVLTEGMFEFNLFFTLTVILLIYKGILAVYLFRKINKTIISVL
ncbi:MAG: hypothetical protein ACTSU4_14540 [Promethearchaeota archaeon]